MQYSDGRPLDANSLSRYMAIRNIRPGFLVLKFYNIGVKKNRRNTMHFNLVGGGTASQSPPSHSHLRVLHSGSQFLFWNLELGCPQNFLKKKFRLFFAYSEGFYFQKKAKKIFLFADTLLGTVLALFRTRWFSQPPTISDSRFRE